LNGRIEGDEFERFVTSEAAIFDGFRGFLIKMGGFFGVIGIDRDDTPRLVMIAALYGIAS